MKRLDDQDHQVRLDSGDRIGSFQGISFVADDVKRTYEELSQRGVEFAGPPQSEEWGTFVIFKDPDGNGFVLGSK